MIIRKIVLPRGRGEEREILLRIFANELKEIQTQIPFRISSRGWCYQLEEFGLSKGDFDKAEAAVNECRALGLVPIDFTAEEEGRKFSGIETPDPDSPAEHLSFIVGMFDGCENSYTPDWWTDSRYDEGLKEKYYIQMLVEKIDLVSLFRPVTRRFKIPIATSKGWSSMLQRAEYARRFKDAEDLGLQCVLLYCGDHDPDGLRISGKIMKNLDDLKGIIWEDGKEGYDPEGLTIDRFGLNYNFIQDNKLSWIDNSEDVPPIGVPKLITGSGKNLADPRHKNHHMSYIQSYISRYGVRKCEANALVIRPNQGQQLCQRAIEKYLGPDAQERFKQKQAIRDSWFDDVRSTIKIGDLTMADAIAIIKDGLDEYDHPEED